MSGPLQSVWRVGRRLLLLLAFLGAGLVLVPAAPRGATGGEAEAAGADRKLNRLRDANRRGVTGFQTFREPEVNALLASRAEQAWGKPPPLRPNVTFTPDALGVFMLRSWGPFRFSLRAEGPVVQRGTGCRWEVQRAWLGRLPVHEFGASWVRGRIAGVLEALPLERELLRRLVRCRLKQGAITIATRPKHAPGERGEDEARRP